MGRQVSSTCVMHTIYKSNYSFHRTPYAILDDQRRIIAVLAGHPFPKNGVPDDWDDVVVRACAAIEAAREEMYFTEKDCNHRRGPHIGRAFGLSHGGGQQVCDCDPFRPIANSFIYTASHDA
jgi:hypothetical protein